MYKRHDSGETTIPMSRDAIAGMLAETREAPTLPDLGDHEVTCPACHGGLNQENCATCNRSGTVTPATFAEFHARVDAP